MQANKISRRDRNHFMTSVSRTFDVLEVFGRAGRPLSYSEVVRETAKPKASIHRILSTLANMGLIAKEKDGRYKLTFKLWGLGMAAFVGMDMVKIAQPQIESLMLATQETAHLAVLDGAACTTYLWKSESDRSIRVQFWVGKRVPSWRSATGRAMLAFLPAQVEALLGDPQNSKEVDKDELLGLLRRVYRQGYAVTKGDNHPEMGGVAAPVRNYTGTVVASCGIAVPRFRMTSQLVQSWVPAVLNTAAQISRELGYSPSDGFRKEFA